MIWGALLGGLIGAGISGFLTYLGLRRTRQASDAEAFGPAVLLLDRFQPDRVMFSISRDPEEEAAKWADVPQQVETARGRLLVVRSGHPRRRVRNLAHAAQSKIASTYTASRWQVADMLANRDNPEWVTHFRKTHAEAQQAMDDLIEANFAWGPRWKWWSRS
jgi:hypothetical protein